jgi:dTDP-glucose 4,6-dehydratase
VHLVILDALTYAGDLTRIEKILNLPETAFIKGDIADRPLVESIFSKYDIAKIVHFAAESHVDRSILGPEEFIRTNIVGTYTLLECARKKWNTEETHLFLHVSTDEVYGSLGPDEAPFTEDSPYNPSSPYSASKAASDHLARSWFHTYGLPVIITNCSNNYGPWQFPEKLIPLMILNALEERELPLYGDGMQIRDWLHVEDHCDAILRAAESGTVGKTYNVGGSCERTNRELVHCICDVVDEVVGREKGHSRRLIRHVTDRPGHDRRYAIDSTRLQRELGWKPRHTIEESLPGLIRWYVEHRQWTDKVRSGEYAEFYQQLYGHR